MNILTIGHSPDADDAFMFYAMAKGIVALGDVEIQHVIEDIESLNHRAKRGELDVTAISAAVYPQVAPDYRILACGASVGRNYGPIVLAKKHTTLRALAGKRIGIPGSHTTAYLLFRLHMTELFQPVILHFERIMSAIEAGEVDAGVVIHEGQLTWEDAGLHNLLDLGSAWMDQTKLPIPLGLDVVSRRFDESVQKKIAEAMEASIRYALDHEEDAVDYALEFGRGIDRETCRRFVRMYVNDDTLNLGVEGKKALEFLYRRAAERRIIEAVPPLDIIGL